MTPRDDVLSRFSGTGPPEALYMPDLTLWYKWHKEKDTLPSDWRGFSLVEVARALNVPAWVVARPWSALTPGIDVTTQEKLDDRVVRYETPAGTLTARWSLGPDGDWWQVEYPVKSIEELPAAKALIESRTYALDASGLARLEALVGDSGVIALEIPMRPYSDLLHTMLGWGEGLMLFAGEGRPVLLEMIAALEEKLQALAAQVAGLAGSLILAPDNLDGQYISPRVFREHLDNSYRRSAGTAHAHGKHLVVHVGGPSRRILSLLTQAGVDGVEGIAGPPQGDVSLAEARQLAGPGLTLWGGVPQDFLVPIHPENDFEIAVREAAREVAGDRRMILGIADRVSTGSDLARLRSIPGLVRGA
jgi:hypothetical protein